MGILSRGGLQCPYLVGDIYITTRSENPSSLWQGTTWEKVGSGRALMGADSTHEVGTTVDSGLPDIAGQLKGVAGASNKAFDWGFKPGNNRAFRVVQTISSYNVYNGAYSIPSGPTADFKASYSNAIYGASTIVQPPAFFCYFWKRLS